MKTFINLIIFDLKRSLCRMNLLISGLFLVICLYLVQTGVDKYKLSEQDMNNHLQLEELREELDQLKGMKKNEEIRIFIMPSVMSVFFGSHIINKSSLAIIPTSESLDIRTSLLNGSVFNTLNNQLPNYSGFIIYGGSFLVMMFGLMAFFHKEFLKFLTGFCGIGDKIFFAILLSRVIFIIFFYAFVSAGAFLLALVNGIEFTSPDLRVYVSFSCVVLGLFLLFLLLGMLFGTIRQESIRSWGPAAAWIVLMLIIPVTVSKYFADKSERISPNYQLGLKKIKLYIEKEKNIREHRDKGKRYFKQDQQKIQEYNEGKGETYNIMLMQRKFLVEFTSLISDYFKISSLFPTIYCLSLEREIGGGFTHLFVLYWQTLEIEDKKTISNLLTWPVSENDPGYYPVDKILKLNSAYYSIPRYFYNGYLIIVLFILLFIHISYSRFERLISGPLSRKYPDTSKMELTIEPGEIRLISAPGKFIDLFFNRLTIGTEEYNGELKMGNTIISKDESKKILYLANPDTLPGNMKIRTLVNFINKVGNVKKNEIKHLKTQLKGIMKKYIKDLPLEEKAYAVLMMMMEVTDCRIYILDNFFSNIEPGKIAILDKKLTLIVEQGGFIIYFYRGTISELPSKANGCSVIYEDEDGYKINRL